MPSLPLPLPARRAVLAASAFALALAAAWWADGRIDTPPGSRPAAPERQVAQAGLIPADVAAPPGPAMSEAATANERSKPPYAPGGDDLLHWEEPTPARGVAGTAAGSPGAEGSTASGADVSPVALAVIAPGAGAQAVPLPDLSAFPIAAAADFFRDGRLGLFTVATAAGAQRASFLSADRQGRWSDRSSALLRDEDRAACAQPRQALAADLNGDDRPDVYLVCGAEPPAACCRHQVFLSQPDGRYRRQDVAASWDGSTDLRDVDGDGRLDAVGEGAPPRVLYGSGDGRFVPEPPRYGRK